MQTPDLSHEEEWIAKYRAALNAFPMQEPSRIHEAGILWERLCDELKTMLRTMFSGTSGGAMQPAKSAPTDAGSQFAEVRVIWKRISGR